MYLRQVFHRAHFGKWQSVGYMGWIRALSIKDDQLHNSPDKQ